MITAVISTEYLAKVLGKLRKVKVLEKSSEKTVIRGSHCKQNELGKRISLLLHFLAFLPLLLSTSCPFFTHQCIATLPSDYGL